MTDKRDNLHNFIHLRHVDLYFIDSFRLVFICGFKSESRSVIIPALDEHRRTSFLLDTEILCLSLSNRLKVDENESSQKVKASSVDFQRFVYVIYLIFFNIKKSLLR